MSESDSFFDFPTASPDSFVADEPEEERSMTFGMLGILVFLDVCFVANYYVNKSLRQCTDAETATLRAEKDFGGSVNLQESGGFSAWMEKIVCGLLMGKVKAMPLSIQTFPGWRPIKYKANIFLSGFFILISLALLNPAVLVPDGLDVGGLTLKAEMCKPFDRQAGLEELRAEVLEITNYTIAVKQWSHLFRFQKALLNDTSRYGVSDSLGDHTCPTIPASGSVREVPGNKAKWADITAYPAAEFGSFFPGYCGSAREAAKLTALSATCVDEKCGCPRIPSTGFTRFFGIDNLEVCWVARICLRSPLACPAHTNDDLINPDNYNEAQLNATDVGEPSINPTRSKLSDASKQAAKAGIMLLLYQVDVASNIYSVYVIVALFFPTPLRVFRLPYMVAIKRFLFGADQKMFIIIFVSSIWIYKYVMEYLTDPDLAIVLANFLRGDPCYLDGKYVYERFAIIDEICDKLIPLQPSFETKMMTVPPILSEINEFAGKSCQSCNFPMQYLFAFRTEIFPLSQVGPLGFTKESPAHMCARRNPNTCRVLLPAENLTFYGNRTICLNSDYAKSRALVRPDTEFSFRAMGKMWISSGLLASFIVKIAMTNFAMGLLHLADPFISCSGKFMWIPTKLGSGLGKRDKNEVFRGFKKNKLKTLQNTYMRTCIIWGTIFHLCVYSLMKSAFSTSQQLYGGLLLGNQDRALLSITSISSAIIIVMAWCWRRVLARKIQAFKGKK